MLAAVGALIGVSLAAELTSYARPDIGFLLDAAARVLDGAKLYVDVVEINPPLIVALNLPAVLVARVLDVSPILVYRLGFAAILLASLALAGRYLRWVAPRDVGLRHVGLVLFAFTLFPLSAQDFGQREHLLLAVIVPYVLLNAVRASGRTIPLAEALVIGLATAVGFALKPHFLPLWIGVEAYIRRLAGRSRRQLFPETVAIGLGLVIYGVAVLTVTPDYLRLVALAAGAYNHFLYDPFFHLLVTGRGAVLVWLALLAFGALRREARNVVLWDLLAIAVLTCFLGGAAQQKGLRYHFYPSFGLAVVLLGLVTVDSRSPLRNGVQRIYRVVASAATLTTIVVVALQNVAQVTRLGADEETKRFEQLVALVRARSDGGLLFVMSYHIGSAYPLVNYSGVRSASRFPQLWMLAAAYLDDLKAARPLRYHRPNEMSPAERYLNQAVLADFEAHDPTLLLVLRHGRDLPVNGYRRLDYVRYFSRDLHMADMLARYQRVADIGDYTLYERLAAGQVRTGSPPAIAPGTQDVIRTDRESMQLKLQDPTLLVAVLVFAAALVLAVRRERAGM